MRKKGLVVLTIFSVGLLSAFAYAALKPNMVRLDENHTAEEELRLAVLFELGFDAGLTDFRDRRGFWKSLERENKRRASAIADGEAVYGQTSYSAANYQDYIVSNLMLRLPERLAGTVIDASEEEVREYYDTHIDEFSAPASVSLKLIEFELADITSAERVERALAEGTAFEDITEGGGAFELRVSEGSKLYSRYGELFSAAKAAEFGKLYGPCETDELITFFKVIQKADAAPFPYEDVRPHARIRALSLALERYIAEEVQKRIVNP